MSCVPVVCMWRSGLCVWKRVYTFISRFLCVCLCVCVARWLSPGQLSTPEETSSWPAVPLAASSMVSRVFSFYRSQFTLHASAPIPPISSSSTPATPYSLTSIVLISVPTTLNSPSCSPKRVTATGTWLFFSLCLPRSALGSPCSPRQIRPDLKLTSWHFHPAVRI